MAMVFTNRSQPNVLALRLFFSVITGTGLSFLGAILNPQAQVALAQTSQPLPENQSLNILNYASQIVRMDYIEMSRNPSSERCRREGESRAVRLGADKRALFYYHRDSNFLGIPDGSGHCYLWLYDSDASRSSLLTSTLTGSLASQVPADLKPLLDSVFPEIPDSQRKINGIEFRHFGFHAFESSDVCLKKVNQWRLAEAANWAVWSHQANNCFGIISRYSFTESTQSELSETTVNLFSWWSPGRGDNFATSNPDWAGRRGDRRTPDYGFSRVEGSVFNPSKPRPRGTIPLYSWWSPSRGDNFVTSNPDWAGRRGDRRLPDYGFVRVEGYIYPPDKPQPSGTIPLYSWWSPSRGDNFITTNPGWAGRRGDRRTPDYGFVRLEGYILPPNS